MYQKTIREVPPTDTSPTKRVPDGNRCSARGTLASMGTGAAKMNTHPTKIPTKTPDTIVAVVDVFDRYAYGDITTNTKRLEPLLPRTQNSR